MGRTLCRASSRDDALEAVGCLRSERMSEHVGDCGDPEKERRIQESGGALHPPELLHMFSLGLYVGPDDEVDDEAEHGQSNQKPDPFRAKRWLDKRGCVFFFETLHVLLPPEG